MNSTLNEKGVGYQKTISIAQKICSKNPRKNRSLFIASLLLVVSGGSFWHTDRSCRSYSEALATSFYSQGSSPASVRNNQMKSTIAFRGGSLFASTEDEIGEVEVNGDLPTIKKFNGARKMKGGEAMRRATINREVISRSNAFFDPNQDMKLHIPARHIAETNLPTDVGHFRLRAYRVEESMQDLMRNMHTGTEPCVIYSSTKPPFGQKDVPVRIHDQCFTSEVFRSQR